MWIWPTDESQARQVIKYAVEGKREEEQSLQVISANQNTSLNMLRLVYFPASLSFSSADSGVNLIFQPP